MFNRRFTGPRPLAELVSELMTPACRKRGIANAALMLDPADVFGERFAKTASVERIVWPKGSRIDGSDEANTGATLVVRADAATALALSHVTGQIVERVNILIGWPAVERVRITQTHARSRRRPSAAAPPPLPPAQVPEAVAERVSGVDDPELKAALARLGAGVARRGSQSGRKNP
jgi:hypothetical protein